MTNKYEVGDIYIIADPKLISYREIIRITKIQDKHWNIFYDLIIKSKNSVNGFRHFNLNSLVDKATRYLGTDEKVIRILYGK